jgi:hypothetical protein
LATTGSQVAWKTKYIKRRGKWAGKGGERRIKRQREPTNRAYGEEERKSI